MFSANIHSLKNLRALIGIAMREEKKESTDEKSSLFLSTIKTKNSFLDFFSRKMSESPKYTQFFEAKDEWHNHSAVEHIAKTHTLEYISTNTQTRALFFTSVFRYYYHYYYYYFGLLLLLLGFTFFLARILYLCCLTFVCAQWVCVRVWNEYAHAFSQNSQYQEHFAQWFQNLASII